MTQEEKTPTPRDTSLADERVYELGYWIAPLIPEEGLIGEVQRLKTLIEEHQGEYITEESARTRPIAYPIRATINGTNHLFTTGYFGWIKFALPSEQNAIGLIEAGVKAHEHVIRFLLIRTVRESTLAPKRIIEFRPTEERTTGKSPVVEARKVAATPISEAELDKTIDDLVIE